MESVNARLLASLKSIVEWAEPHSDACEADVEAAMEAIAKAEADREPMTDKITSAGCCDCALGRPCDVHPKREAFTSKQQVGCTVTHDLKCWTEFFPAVLDGSKPFEIRENDRDYEVGHFLRLREWDREGMVYTGREVTKRVTYLTDFAQRCDYVVLGLAVETTCDRATPVRASTVHPRAIELLNEMVELAEIGDADEDESWHEVLEEARELIALNTKTAAEHAIPARVCPDSEDGNHVLKQDGPFSVVYCDACGMNRGWRTQEPENRTL